MKSNEQTNGKLILKSMLVTFCVIALILIGYFGTGYFFGDL